LEEFKIDSKSKITESNSTWYRIKSSSEQLQLCISSIKEHENRNKKAEETIACLKMVQNEKFFLRPFFTLNGNSASFIAIITENYEGSLVSLQSNISKNRDDLRQVSLDILSGLEFLENNNIIHGKISKESIKIVRKEGHYRGKIGNFADIFQIVDESQKIVSN
jgi:serine/threonine protein kinase